MARRGGSLTWKVRRPTVVRRSRTVRRSFRSYGGGQGDMRQLSWGHRSGGGTPPFRRYLGIFRPLRLTLSSALNDVEAHDDKGPRGSSRSRLQGKIPSISAADSPKGDCEAPFSKRLPPSRGGLRPFASPYSHKTNRRWAASAAAAQPRIAAARGRGVAVRNSKGSTADVRVQVRNALNTV